MTTKEPDRAVPLTGFRDRLERQRELRRASAMLAAADPTGDTARLLSGVSLRVHPADPMYVRGEAERYLAVGLSATRVIREAVQSGSKNLSIGAVLDFPCGYGRVLRFLRALFPSARITGAELDTKALRFSRRNFSVDAWQATPDPVSLAADRKFDLIWCGSLVTHFDERKALSLLQLFDRSLAEPGVCIVSVHGATSVEWIRTGRYTYGLTSSGQEEVIAGYEGRGYGYADLAGSPGYGISATSAARMRTLIADAGKWARVKHCQNAWDHHHDVYVLWK